MLMSCSTFIVIAVLLLQRYDPRLLLKFNFSEKATKISAIFLMVLTLTKWMSKPWGRLRKILWPSHKSWTLCTFWGEFYNLKFGLVFWPMAWSRLIHEFLGLCKLYVRHHDPLLITNHSWILTQGQLQIWTEHCVHTDQNLKPVEISKNNLCNIWTSLKVVLIFKIRWAWLKN